MVFTVSGVAARPTYRVASVSGVAPANRGTTKKIANVMTLTMKSRPTAASSRRTIYATTVVRHRRPARVLTRTGRLRPSPAYRLVTVERIGYY